MPGVEQSNPILRISGDINVEKTIQIDEIPPTLKVMEFTADNGTVVQSIPVEGMLESNAQNSSANAVANVISPNCYASIKAVVRNVGKPGTFYNLGWYVNSVLDEDLGAINGVISLGTGEERTFYYIFNGSNLGSNTIELKHGDAGLGNVEVYCTEGGNQPE